MQHPTCIVFHRANKLGDDVVALKAFYAAKILYPHTKILVFTNTFGATLYSCAPFVDEIINLDDDISLAQHTIDILIITQNKPQYRPCKTHKCQKNYYASTYI